jgi:microcystin-dependent protein
MEDVFISEICLFAFDFPPKGCHSCDGQIMSIQANTALFSLVGTAFGGNGKNTFCLPDLQGRIPIGWGQGVGLSLRDLGESGGEEAIALSDSEMPAHTHTLNLATVDDQSNWKTIYNFPSFNMSSANNQAIQIAGGSLPHANMQPYLALNYCIVTSGIFPPRP